VKVLITGASSGIGADLAKIGAQQSWSLLLTGRNAARLALVAEDCLQAGAPEVATVVGDLTDLATQDELCAKFGMMAPDDVPVWVNNAGMGIFEPADAANPEGIDQMLDLNLRAVMHLGSRLIGPMTAQKGHIVNVLSIVLEEVLPYSAAYAASKAGLLAYMRVVLKENRKKGLAVTNVYPGAVDTPIWDGMSSTPNRADMIPSEVAAAAIAMCISLPRTVTLESLVLTPPKGIL
jgi:short-subunit dehydrogenase